MFSIVIPVYNEERTIVRLLNSIIDCQNKKLAEIIIICNGCTDNSYQVIKGLFPNVTCENIAEASKTQALNRGDEVARYFPRIYLDADIEISADTLIRLSERIKKDNLLLSSPTMKMNLSGCSFIVKSFYSVWLDLPYVKNNMIGCGIFALSKEARDRFNQFPEIISDDYYVYLQFKESERTVFKDLFFTHNAPKNLKHLLNVRVRVLAGNFQLRSLYKELFKEKESHSFMLKSLLKNKPSSIFSLPIYFVITILSRWRAVRQLKTNSVEWKIDASTR